MPPSDSAIFRSGNLRRVGDQMRSAAALTMFIGVRLINTSIGASGEVITSSEEDPMCMQTTTCSSEQACQNGSQWSEWTLGQPSLEGFSENVTAWAPLAAQRRTSAASTSGSQMAGMGQ